MEALAKFNVKHIEINTFEDLKKHPELAGLGIDKTGVPAYVVIEKEKKEKTP